MSLGTGSGCGMPTCCDAANTNAYSCTGGGAFQQLSEAKYACTNLGILNRDRV